MSRSASKSVPVFLLAVWFGLAAGLALMFWGKLLLCFPRIANLLGSKESEKR